MRAHQVAPPAARERLAGNAQGLRQPPAVRDGDRGRLETFECCGERARIAGHLRGGGIRQPLALAMDAEVRDARDKHPPLQQDPGSDGRRDQDDSKQQAR
jgi:hypothetical protein